MLSALSLITVCENDNDNAISMENFEDLLY